MTFQAGRPVVFRDAFVITMDRTGVIEDGDLLVIGDTIADVGVDFPAPPDAVEIDASGGILMPGMIDTHRHMWQAALRGSAWYDGMHLKIADIQNPYSYTDAGDARVRAAASGRE